MQKQFQFSIPQHLSCLGEGLLVYSFMYKQVRNLLDFHEIAGAKQSGVEMMVEFHVTAGKPGTLYAGLQSLRSRG